MFMTIRLSFSRRRSIREHTDDIKSPCMTPADIQEVFAPVTLTSALWPWYMNLAWRGSENELSCIRLRSAKLFLMNEYRNACQSFRQLEQTDWLKDFVVIAFRTKIHIAAILQETVYLFWSADPKCEQGGTGWSRRGNFVMRPLARCKTLPSVAWM